MWLKSCDRETPTKWDMRNIEYFLGQLAECGRAEPGGWCRSLAQHGITNSSQNNCCDLRMCCTIMMIYHLTSHQAPPWYMQALHWPSLPHPHCTPVPLSFWSRPWFRLDETFTLLFPLYKDVLAWMTALWCRWVMPCPNTHLIWISHCGLSEAKPDLNLIKYNNKFRILHSVLFDQI